MHRRNLGIKQNHMPHEPILYQLINCSFIGFLKLIKGPSSTVILRDKNKKAPHNKTHI